MIRLPIHKRLAIRKKPIALASPAKCIYLSIEELMVIVATVPDTIARAKGLRFSLIVIMCMCFNYSTNINKITDIKKYIGNYFAKSGKVF
tara:strand:+ start:1584 stop:1853 length:270 start_codon:yes stop_codon:yes gene_type:complete